MNQKSHLSSRPTPTLFNLDVDDAFDFFISTVVAHAEDLHLIDGETAFRRCSGTIETFDTEFALNGGRS